MRKQLRKPKKFLSVLVRLASITLIISCFLIFCDMRVRPVIKRKVRDCARVETTTILNKTLLKQIDSLNIVYGDLVNINYNDEGYISSIEANTSAINYFKASFSLSVANSLREIDNFTFYIRVGTLLGPEFLTERGPKINFRVSSSENVQTEIVSRFEEAGINQTVHKILLEVTINICCYFPGYTTSANVQTELTLAETVIVGNVPKFFSS